ncbi:hypothetical protein QQ045_015958 [Rhodiola kirilowii]
MGKWNNRWIPNPRSHRHDNRGRFQRELPPPYPAESSENSVPEWEKRFCYEVGSVPWRKVLDTKSFASYYPDVMDWDASEAKDTFHTAKRRFLALMNGLPTDDVPLPDPNAYIDKIDWNTCIDTELFMDLERALLGPDPESETEFGGSGVVDISALTQNSRWQEWNHGTADDVWNSGGCWDKSNDGGWPKPDNWGLGPVNALTEDPTVTKSGDTPWDCEPANTVEPVKNIPRGECSDNWGSKQPEHTYMTKNQHDVANPQDGNFQGWGLAKDNGWASSGNNSWGRNRPQNKSNGTKGWGYGSIHLNGGSAAREWVRHVDSSRCENARGNNPHKQTDTYDEGIGNWESGDRESSNNYAPRSKSPRFLGTNNQRHDQREVTKPWSNGQSMQRSGSAFRSS